MTTLLMCVTMALSHAAFLIRTHPRLTQHSAMAGSVSILGWMLVALFTCFWTVVAKLLRVSVTSVVSEA